MRLSEEGEGQSNDDGCDGAPAYSDNLAHIDRNLDVGWSRSDDCAVGTARRVRVAVPKLACLKDNSDLNLP